VLLKVIICVLVEYHTQRTFYDDLFCVHNKLLPEEVTAMKEKIDDSICFDLRWTQSEVQKSDDVLVCDFVQVCMSSLPFVFILSKISVRRSQTYRGLK